MGKISIDLASLLEGINHVVPTANPNLGAPVDEQGFLLDKSGTPLPSNYQKGGADYIDPSLKFQPLTGSQAFWNPSTADQISRDNASFTQQAPIAAQANTINRSIAGGNFGANRPFANLPLNDPSIPNDVAAARTTGELSPGNFNAQDTAAARLRNDVPNLTGIGDALDIGAHNTELQNDIQNKGPVYRGIGNAFLAKNRSLDQLTQDQLGLPITSNLHLDSALKLGMTKNASDESLLPHQTQVESGRLNRELAVQPFEQSAAVDEAKLHSQISHGQLDDAQTTLNTLKQQRRTAAREASYPAPLGNSLTYDSSGRLTRNPLAPTKMDMMNAGMQGSNLGASKPIPLSSGLGWVPNSNTNSPVVKTQDFSRPIRTAPITNTPTINNQTPVKQSIGRLKHKSGESGYQPLLDEPLYPGGPTIPELLGKLNPSPF